MNGLSVSAYARILRSHGIMVSEEIIRSGVRSLVTVLSTRDLLTILNNCDCDEWVCKVVLLELSRRGVVRGCKVV